MIGQRIIFAAVALLLGGAAQAEQHAISSDEAIMQQEPRLQPAGVREVCSTMDFGFGEIRTDCRTEAVAPIKVDPALAGICTIYYGRRTCY